jgi:LysR family carnitine catabolism transcriptional activator
MSISIPQVRGFLILAEHLSFRRAANELNITQPALSNQVKTLEQSLGVRLFVRTTRSVELTEEGMRFFRSSRRALAEFDSAIGSMSTPTDARFGFVTFACIPTIAGHAFPRIIRQYIKQNPQVTIEMIDQATAGMERKILDRDVDFGVGGRPRRRDEFTFVPLLSDPFVVVCKKDHPLAKKKAVRIEDAMKYPVICLAKGSNVRETIRTYFSDIGRNFTPAFELIHHYTVGAMVEAGLGIAFLPAQATAMIASPRVKIVPLADKAFARDVGLITRKGYKLSASAADFYAFTLNIMKTMNRSKR